MAQQMWVSYQSTDISDTPPVKPDPPPDWWTPVPGGTGETGPAQTNSWRTHQYLMRATRIVTERFPSSSCPQIVAVIGARPRRHARRAGVGRASQPNDRA